MSECKAQKELDRAGIKLQNEGIARIFGSGSPEHFEACSEPIHISEELHMRYRVNELERKVGVLVSVMDITAIMVAIMAVGIVYMVVKYV